VPPVVGPPVGSARPVWEVPQPPQMMQPDVAPAPLAAGHLAHRPLKIGVVIPVVAAAGHRPRLAPVIIPQAVGSKMDRAALGSPRKLLIIARKTLPQVGVAARALKGLADERFGPLAQVFQHLAH